MIHCKAILLTALIGFVVNAQTINLHGKVSNQSGKPVAGAIVTLAGQGLKDTTNTDGVYAITKNNVSTLPMLTPHNKTISMDRGFLLISLPDPSPVAIEIFDVKGTLLKRESQQDVSTGFYRFDIAAISRATEILLVRASAGRHEVTFRYLPLCNDISTMNHTIKSVARTGGGLAKITAVNDSLKTTADGYTEKVIKISNYDTTVAITLDTAAAAVSGGCGKTNSIASGKTTIDVDGAKREYILKLPNNYDPNKSYKLIFCIHAWGGNYEQIAQGGYYGLEKLANNTAIFVSPQGLEDDGNPRGWANPKGRDIKFIKAVVNYLNANACIDQKRIFSTGFSYGGMMSFAISCAMSDVFRAIAPMSGAFYSGCDSTSSNPIAMWMAHGTGDKTVPIADGRKALKYILSKNGCGNETKPVTPSPCVAYQGCKEGYPVIYCEFDGGHAPQTWAQAATWEFFSQF